tara:strand:+ start:94 stop:5430 length:5337 start_codon:yes stop_codon:yes gene_type:complete
VTRGPYSGGDPIAGERPTGYYHSPPTMAARSAKSLIAASKRRLGAANFNAQYTAILDGAMPRDAPEEEDLRAEISLGQAFGGRDMNATSVTNYERVGIDESEEFRDRHDTLNTMRQEASETDVIVEGIRDLPPGHRLSPAYNLNGQSLGELVTAITAELGGNTLRGLYLDASVVNLNLIGKVVGMTATEPPVPIVSFNQTITEYTTTRLPLWQVTPLLPRDDAQPHGFVGGTIWERKQGFERTMRILYGDHNLRADFEISDETDPDIAMHQGDIGSDLSSYYITGNARLVRRVRAPTYVDNRTSQIRTGGFSELLTETSEVKITLEEVVDAYVLSEELNTTDFPEDYVSEFRRVVGQIFTGDIFTMDEPCITLILPGGTQEVKKGGCCVDIATFHYLEKEYDTSRARVLMADIRDRFEALYVEWRIKKKLSRKRVRGGPGDGSVVITPYSATQEERASYLRDLRNTTAHGYSSQVFKFYQMAVHCITGYLPCIYYHRIEKARDYNQGVRVRMVQVGGGALTKELSTTHARETLVQPDMENQVPYYPVNMLRININGEIHRHRPKTLCMEETTEFIPDDDSTGLLHAITIYPGLPDDLFKGVHAKRREVLMGVIEKKTKALMSYYKRVSVGLCSPSAEMMSDAVEEQLRRQDSGKTHTLIYGTTAPNPLSTPEETEAHEEGPAVYFSNSFDREGRKIPERPLVIAYDLETVELTSEAISSGAVGAEFLRDNPDRTKYIECEREIPYCVSWVPVNLTDEGRHRETKEELHRKGTACSEVRDEEKWAGEWERTNSFVYCSDGRRVREGYVMLSDVKVHYGGGVLGRCVNEFIDAVVEWAMDRGYTSVSAYAHNGVGFDSYVVQAFNTRYEYHSILKTSRGLLSMRMKIPFTTSGCQRKIFPMTFLDTKVFLSFSLSKLCVDFRVPEGWGKLDFPITKINWENCYKAEVVEILEPYSINDTRALAYIVKQINRIVCLETEVVHIPGSDELTIEAFDVLQGKKAESLMNPPITALSGTIKSIHPPNASSPKPPITQFCTIMSCVKRVASMYVREVRKLDHFSYLTRMPAACDLPCIRHWVEMASMGGRVSAYAKMYCSSRWADVLHAYMLGDSVRVADIIKEAIKKEDTHIVLDVTSLYPSAMAYCAMPMGSLRFVPPGACNDLINAIGCITCETLMQLCPTHRCTTRPFAVIVIKGGLKRGARWNELNKNNPTRHLIGRKMKGRRERGGGSGPDCRLPGPDVSGIIYTNEEDEEMTSRHWGEGSGDSVLGETQSYTNIDLYWALKSGYVFEIVGGYEWETSYELQPLILNLFEMRVAAKAEGNTCLQQAIKLLLNSLFGIHSQRVIRSVDKVVTLPENIREADVKEEEFARYIRANHQKIFDPRMVLKENIPLVNGQSMIRATIPGNIGEAVGGYSPNHIGCAVLAWSRHIMSLAMFDIPTGHLTYTDTDSLAVSEWWYNKMLAVGKKGTESRFSLPNLICTKGTDLMTYKNDHSDYFPNARVLFSAIGAKKVKMHVIGCPDTGQLKVCSTFKGFLKKDVLNNGDRLHKDQHEYTMAKTLLDILYTGKPEAYEGTRWSKSLGADGGVTIDKNVRVQGSSYTYLGKHKAFSFMEQEHTPGAVLINIPFGTEITDMQHAAGVPPYTLTYVVPTKTLTKQYRLTCGLPSFQPPKQFDYALPSSYEKHLFSYMRCVTKGDMYSFIERVFSKRNELYRPPPSEEEEEGAWDKLIAVFNPETVVFPSEEPTPFPDFPEFDDFSASLMCDESFDILCGGGEPGKGEELF